MNIFLLTKERRRNRLLKVNCWQRSLIELTKAKNHLNLYGKKQTRLCGNTDGRLWLAYLGCLKRDFTYLKLYCKLNRPEKSRRFSYARKEVIMEKLLETAIILFIIRESISLLAALTNTVLEIINMTMKGK